MLQTEFSYLVSGQTLASWRYRVSHRIFSQALLPLSENVGTQPDQVDLEVHDLAQQLSMGRFRCIACNLGIRGSRTLLHKRGKTCNTESRWKELVTKSCYLQKIPACCIRTCKTCGNILLLCRGL
jgi:hypothetical protein